MKQKYYAICSSLFIIIINLGTLFYVAPLSQNLSDLGSSLGHPLYLRVWAISAAGCFYWYTSRLFKKINRYTWKQKTALYAVCIGMISSVFLPYLPYLYPTLAKWHTRLAMWSTIGYVLLFFYYLSELMKRDYALYTYGFRYYLILVIFDCLLYLLNGGVSTLLEISFTIGMSILLPLLYYKE